MPKNTLDQGPHKAKQQAKPVAKQPDQRIWAIAGPSIIANSSAPLVGLVDSWAVGQLGGPLYLAAIGVGATLFSFMLWSFGFLRMGTTGLVAQATGRGDAVECASHILRAMALGLLLGCVLLLLSAPLYALGVWALDVPADVHGPLGAYYDVRILSLPITLTSYGIMGALLGGERPKAALAVQLLLNISNGALNLLFVIGLDMGVVGIAWGTVLAELLAFGLGLYLLWQPAGLLPFRQAFAAKLFDRGQLTALFQVNGPLFIRTLILITAFAMVTHSSAQLGAVALAASQVLNTYVLLISLGLDGFAYAAETLVGQATGVRNRAGFTFWARRTSLWALLMALIYSAAFGLFGPSITALITPDLAVRAAVGEAALILSILPLVGVGSYMFDGIYIGAGATRAMMGTMMFSVGIYGLFLYGWALDQGIAGIWGAILLLLALRALSQGLWLPRVINRVCGSDQLN